MTDLSVLLSDVRRERLRGIRELASPLSADAAFVLRRVLYTDRDAHVRAAAARALASCAFAEPWLLERISDGAPLVRDALIRALARCGSPAAFPALRDLAEHDLMWWVRRAAIYALASLVPTPCPEPELATFTRTLADPFWRVRQAAVRVLSLLGARDPEVRESIIEEAAPTSTLAFLRGTWGPAAIDAPSRATAPSALPTALLDPDPAVVTARVPIDPDVTPVALVELLCDPHAPLRDVVIERLLSSPSLDAFEAALDWLEEPRIPHVVDTVLDLLDRLGEPALAIAERALTRRDRPAAARWAAGWIVGTHAETLYDLALDRANERDADPEVRRALLPLATDEELVHWAVHSLADDKIADSAHVDPSHSSVCTLVDDIAVELHDRSAFDELLALDSSHPRVRALQVDAAARRRDWPRVELAAADLHHAPRAIAARWLVRKHQRDASAFAADVDPAVREAALSGIVVEHGSAALPAAIEGLADADPAVRRAAIRALVVASRHLADSRHDESRSPPAAAVMTSVMTAPETASDSQLPSRFVDACVAALDSPDPAIRRMACELPLVDDSILAAVIARTADRDEGVSAAAADALDRLPNSDQRIDALLATTTLGCARALAFAWRLRRLDEATIGLARDAYARETDDQARTLLLAVIAAGPLVVPTASIADTAATPDAPSQRIAAFEVAASTAIDERRARFEDPRGIEHRAAFEPPAVEHRSSGHDETAFEPPAAAVEAGTFGREAEFEPPAAAVEGRRPVGRDGAFEPPAAVVARRPFGRAGFDVAPLAISGAFDLPPAGLDLAAAAGIDTFFWEPGYDVLGRWVRGKNQLRVISGTYHADGASIRADVERALKQLRRDTLDAFLLFWTRSPARLDASAFAMLDRLKRDGKIRAAGFSTHHRELAREAIEERDWDVVMIRHSAAHPGIESELLPTARERGTAIVTFSALTYGRLTSGRGAPTPAECYRYSLAQDGVTACISAPRRTEELAQNLAALVNPTMEHARQDELRAHGRGVRLESARVNTLLRQPTRDAAAAAREMLASEPAPTRDLQVPLPTAARRSRARLGGGRRRR